MTPYDPRDCREGDTKRGNVGFIKVKEQVDFRIHFRQFKAFLDHVFFTKGAGYMVPDYQWKPSLILKWRYVTLHLNQSLLNLHSIP